MSNLQEAMQLLRQLVGFNTAVQEKWRYANSTVEATEFVADYLKSRTGAEIIYGKPYEYPANSGNMHRSMIAVWRPENEEAAKAKPLAFSAHIDTVPAKGTWNGYEPTELHVEDDKLIGRGAIDMKGQIASFMTAMHDMAGLKKELHRPVMLMLSSCEEVGIAGAKDVCWLAKKNGLYPSEVIVMEPTDGYVGIGSKGSRLDSITFTSQYTDPEDEYYQFYTEIEIKAESGHSSIQSASPADPAIGVTRVLDMVRSLRAGGIVAEICGVDYGIADNMVGGAAKIVIGYNTDTQGLDQEEEPQDFFAARKVHNWISSSIAALSYYSNMELAFVTRAANTINGLRHEISGMDFGHVKMKTKSLGYEYKGNETSADGEGFWIPQDSHVFPVRAFWDLDNIVCYSAVEEAVRVTADIFKLHNDQKKGGVPQGYAVPALGYTKMAVPVIKGRWDEAYISFDVRFPKEAMNERKLDGIDFINDAVDDILYKAQGVVAHRYHKHTIFPFTNVFDDRVKSYVDIAKRTGFSRYRSAVTELPYCSDGNMLKYEFPDAAVLTMGSGGFSNMPHGKGEHITRMQIHRNIDLFEEIVLCRATKLETVSVAASKG